MDIPTPPSQTTRPTTATADTAVPRQSAASGYNNPAAFQPMQTQQQTQQPNGTPAQLMPAPCPACTPPSKWPWIIALLVGGGLGYFIAKQGKGSKARD